MSSTVWHFGYAFWHLEDILPQLIVQQNVEGCSRKEDAAVFFKDNEITSVACLAEKLRSGDVAFSRKPILAKLIAVWLRPILESVVDLLTQGDVRDVAVLSDHAGTTLRQLERSEIPAPPMVVAQIGQQILDAVTALHEVGFVHDDLNNLNVCVKFGNDGTFASPHVTLIDWDQTETHGDSDETRFRELLRLRDLLRGLFAWGCGVHSHCFLDHEHAVEFWAKVTRQEVFTIDGWTSELQSWMADTKPDEYLQNLRHLWQTAASSVPKNCCSCQ